MAQEGGHYGIGGLLRTRRWLPAASGVIAGASFLEGLKLAGRNAELGGLLPVCFLGYREM